MWHDDDDLDDREWPDDEGEDEDDDETVPCPHCRMPVYEDAEQCPSCGKYLSREDVPWRRPFWLLVGVVMGLLIVAYWNLR
jgi:hypothetical protein